MKSDQSTSLDSASKFAVSCAECRRSKLKCDRTFPCQSCIRRGCANICPDGTLPATKSNKALVVRAQRLTEEVDELKSRIHELEAAIENAHLESNSNSSASRFPSEGVGATIEDSTSALSPAIHELVSAFPLGKKDHDYPIRVFDPYMPQRQDAFHWVCLFYEKLSYINNIVPSEDFFAVILNAIYPDAELGPTLSVIAPHSLSIFFATVALGIMCDKAENRKGTSERYHSLARAALSFCPLSSDATCATIQAIFLIIRLTQKVHSCVSEECWLLNGINNRLIHKLGLYQDGQTSAIVENERQAARKVFWEVVTWDTWACFISDRPGYFSLKHTNCAVPTNTTCQISGKDLTWSIWKYTFTTRCVTVSLDYTLGFQDPPYSAIIDVDNKIRIFPLPTGVAANLLQTGPEVGWSSDPFTAAQEYSALCVAESTLIFLHKKYFLQAMSLNPEDPFSTAYQFSARAILRSTSQIITGMIKLCEQHGNELILTWFLWSSLFISTNILRDFTIQCPRCPVSKSVLQLYEQAMLFYENAMAGVSEGPLAKLRAFYGKACNAVSMAGDLSSAEHTQGFPSNPLQLPSQTPYFDSHLNEIGWQVTQQGFQSDLTGASWLSPQHSTQYSSSLGLLSGSSYDPSMHVPESEFGYQQQWDATQQWEDFVAAFKVPDHEFLDRSL